MLKHVYRLIACLFCFGFSIMYFSKNINEQIYINDEKKVTMSEATYPVMYFISDKERVNRVTGYSANLGADAIRDGLIPLKTDKKVNFVVKPGEVQIKKASYEISDQGGQKIESSDISEFTLNKDGSFSGSFKIDKDLRTGNEYCLKISLMDGAGNKIHFFERLYYGENAHMKEMVTFVKNFHNCIFDKEKAKEVVKNIEPDRSMDNKSLAYVNIHSSLDLISFGSLAPKKVSEVIPTIREATDQTAIIELNYFVKASTGSGEELYKVSEGYRVRWTATRMYLLYYERYMEQIFDMKLASTAKSQLKLGITNNTEVASLVSADESKMAFVRSNELWFYNLAVNTAFKVFSFRQENTDYIRDVNEDHGIELLSMDTDGNLRFMVYGYMNRGEYEGRLAIVLYEYSASRNRIQELVYIPVDLPFSKLKDQINSFAYINSSKVYYFTINNNIYSYNLVTKKLDVIAENINKEDMVMPASSGICAYMAEGEEKKAITVLDMESGKEYRINPPKDGFVKLLGTIGSFIIYGNGDLANCGVLPDGTEVYPMERVYIVDSENHIRKSYINKEYFVTGAQTIGSKICLQRVKKNGSRAFITADDDYIYNNDAFITRLESDSRVTEKTMTEWYLKLPETMKFDEVPQTSEAGQTKISDDTVLRIDLHDDERPKFYVFAFHGLEETYDNAKDAVIRANERMGIVYDNAGRRIWERGVAGNQGNAGSITEIKAASAKEADVKKAAMKILIAQLGGQAEDEELSLERPMIDVLNDLMDNKAVNLSGVGLDEVLYYISMGSPVLALNGEGKPVILTAYNEYTVTCYDPATGKYATQPRSKASAGFKESGNTFISYVNQ